MRIISLSYKSLIDLILLLRCWLYGQATKVSSECIKSLTICSLSLSHFLFHHALKSLKYLIFRAKLEYESEFSHLFAFIATSNLLFLYLASPSFLPRHFEPDLVLFFHMFQWCIAQFVRAVIVFALDHLVIH